MLACRDATLPAHFLWRYSPAAVIRALHATASDADYFKVHSLLPMSLGAFSGTGA